MIVKAPISICTTNMAQWYWTWSSDHSVIYPFTQQRHSLGSFQRKLTPYKKKRLHGIQAGFKRVAYQGYSMHQSPPLLAIDDRKNWEVSPCLWPFPSSQLIFCLHRMIASLMSLQRVKTGKGSRALGTWKHLLIKIVDRIIMLSQVVYSRKYRSARLSGWWVHLYVLKRHTIGATRFPLSVRALLNLAFIFLCLVWSLKSTSVVPAFGSQKMTMSRHRESFCIQCRIHSLVIDSRAYGHVRIFESIYMALVPTTKALQVLFQGPYGLIFLL